MARGKLTDEVENEAVRLNLRVMLAAARARGPMSLDQALALCEAANKEFSRGTSKQS